VRVTNAPMNQRCISYHAMLDFAGDSARTSLLHL